MAVVYRPLPMWPHKPTAARRAAQFRTASRYREGGGYTPGQQVPIERTVRELEYEVDQLRQAKAARS